MKTHPILFSGPMVRAILDGKKTQTRRVITTNIPDAAVNAFPIHKQSNDWNWHNESGGIIGARLQKQPTPGDLFWVRETWSGIYAFRDTPPKERQSYVWEGIPYYKEEVWHWADGSPEYGDWEKPRPSIHMPRYASRLTLRVTDVRVQRLQDISEDDADAECFGGDFPHAVLPELFNPETSGNFSIPECFAKLWDSINGSPRKKSNGTHGPDISWAANPWVVAYSFEPIHKNIDAVLV